MAYRRPFSSSPRSVRASVASGGGGGGSDIYTPRAPTGSDLYVDFGAGSDGSGSSGSPWNTLSNARLQTLSAGQQLVVTGNGVFPDSTSQVTNGISGNRIVVRAHPSSPGSGFTFSGLGARTGGGSYWDFYNLALACSGGHGFALNQRDDFGGGLAANYVRFIDCVGTKSAEASSVNAGTGIIYATDGSSTGIEVIRGSYTGTGAGNGNCACLWFDYAESLNILGVLIQSAPTPLYFKHTDVNSSATPGGTVKNCIFLNGDNRMSLNYVDYLNNAFFNSQLGLDEQGGGLDNSKNCNVNHNTFYDSDWMAAQQNGGAGTSNNTCRNNAMLGTSRFLNAPFSASDASNDIDYTANEGAGTNHYYRNSTQRTLAGYQATYGTQETHGVAGSIALVGGSTPGSTAANWAMSSGVGKNAASDGTDCGVDATKLLTVN